jgi:hypothetical protein
MNSPIKLDRRRVKRRRDIEMEHVLGLQAMEAVEAMEDGGMPSVSDLSLALGFCTLSTVSLLICF